VVVLIVGLRQCSADEESATTATVGRAGSADGAVPPPASRPALPVSTAPDVQAQGAEPAAAPRMRALMLAVDAGGVRLERAVAVAGRVKAPPVSFAPNRLEFEVYDAGGRRIYEGSFDHPRHAHAENVDANGELSRAHAPSTGDTLMLRIPAELAAVRIQFFEVLAGAERRAISSVELL
jgi:hypothetical protein